jgi:hypothetical protein
MHWTGAMRGRSCNSRPKKGRVFVRRGGLALGKEEAAPIFLHDLTYVTFSSLSGGYCQPTVPDSVLTP